MNHVFRIVFNSALRVYQAVSELTSGLSKNVTAGVTPALHRPYKRAPFRYSVVMLALFSSGSSFAEEYGQIVVDDPSGNTQIILAPGAWRLAIG